ncbi:MAG: ATP-binding cassette domain-containing protein [Firmicutes bacterium]|nr:ATP-binding cassette domain-containing protein [Bacillota bacterium]
MIRVEKLSYGFPAKDLFKDISFTLETGQHCALIGSNGCGKSTLVDMIIDTEKYLYDGKIIKDDSCRIGYASQFSVRDKARECSVFEFLSERFLKLQQEIAIVCEEMAVAEDMEAAFEKYQNLLDLNEAMDGDNYESNIRKQLSIAGMKDLEETKLSQISGGEYKLLQIIKEMLLSPNLLVLDEPDVFLDFANLNGLCKLINEYKGTILVVTHNRYLLNHCFNKILHLENGELQEFEGNYTEYRLSLFEEKLRLKLQSIEEQEEIERTEKMVEILRKRATILVNPAIGKSVNAKQSQLERLIARQIKAPFIDVPEPDIMLPLVEKERLIDENCAEEEKKVVLKVSDYQVSFDKELLQNVSFEVLEGEKVAIAGKNGTGKTSLIKDILTKDNPAIHMDENIKYACLSQLQGDLEDGDRTVYQVMQDAGFGAKESIREYLAGYCLGGDMVDQKVSELSGGEQNLLQIAIIASSDAEFLILDEPTSHLDLYAQIALEKAIDEYKGTVLMVTHDFYLAANCADYVLYVEDSTVRRVRTRTFRKMVYDKYFDSKYLEMDKKKQELEANITSAFKKNDFEAVDKLCTQLQELSEK